MKIFKSHIIPILLGTIAGVITLWALDSFEKQDYKYFIKAFLKCLFIPLAVVLVLNLKRTKA